MNTPFEKRICFTICICQLTAVLSCVSVVYLTVAVYNPAYKILNSGFIEKPVMCTTVEYVTPPNCDDENGPGGGGGWNSCSEWCLSKSSGSCPRIMVDVRHNGSDIRLENCEGVNTTWCHGVDPNKPQLECYKGDCQTMHGLYNCTANTNVAGVGTDTTYGSRCRELTSILDCNITQWDDPVTCHKVKNCLELNGLYKCSVGECRKVRPPYNCHKHCIGIQTGNKSVLIRQGDVIFSAKCEKAVDIGTGQEIFPLDYANKFPNNIEPMLVMFCTTLTPAPDNRTYIMSDCFNGTLMEPDFYGPTTDIKVLLRSHTDAIEQGAILRDQNQDHRLIGPTESDLLIFNYTRLYINYESCVNTLILNECEKFYAEYGVDGADYRTQARYQCYYSPNSSLFASLRFNRMQTALELLLATVIPFTLAIVSCFTLVICTRIIHVGDDSHFYFQCCGADPKATLEKEAVEAMAL